MANRTATEAKTIHGMNPQFLIEKIIRTRIYDSIYWKEQCFALTAETIIDKAVSLQSIGGQYGNQKPTEFLCLALKMLQLQPEKEIVRLYLQDEDYKYLRALAAFYLRLTGTAIEIYQYLEPLLLDYRKLRRRTNAGEFELTHMDEFVDELLHSDRVCDTILPRITKRHILEENGDLPPRISPLEEGLEEEEILDTGSVKEASSDKEDANIQDKRNPSRNSDERQARPGASRRTRDERDGRSRSRARDRWRSRSRSFSRSRSRSCSRSRHRRSGRDRNRRDSRDRDTRSRHRYSSKERNRSSQRRNRQREDYESERNREQRRDISRDRDRHASDRVTGRDEREREDVARRSRRVDDEIRGSSRDRGGEEQEQGEIFEEDVVRRKPVVSARKVDALFKKKPSDSLGISAKSAGAQAGHAGAESLSIEETNKMRASLGLKPLKM